MKELELYLHIPFCERKCAYCDFLSAPADMPVRISYIKKLQEEIAYYGAQYGEYQVSSIFLAAEHRQSWKDTNSQLYWKR